MAPYQVQIIQDWPEPRKVKDVQSFLGFANFYQQFMFGYSEITVPLTCLTHKGTTWHFTNECCSAFEALKKAFTTAPVLTHWIPDTQITVESDASDYALAAVLSITNSNGELHLIAFHSRHFLPRNSIMMFMTKSYSRFLKLSNVGDIILKALHSRSTWSPIPEFAILLNNQNPHMSASTMVRIPFCFQPHHPFSAWKTWYPT